MQGPHVAAVLSAAKLGFATVNVLQANPSASLADKVLAKQPYVLVSGLLPAPAAEVLCKAPFGS
jgi:hypothetical protein